ncbi:hypothetical protein B0J11DRAFT_296636 [Dendryphion nanum]|uniref:Uncharacterized protein n=1 Tax=Dendryphion nanum TaxID=256645 RepID=A0A9P9INV5_9PLEO|nr:hypothetical protein B0J11DRAFT_296636 [Dendryphion nanum]
MSELDNRYVKLGLWTDWSKGPVMGKTITTNIATGTILISALAVFCSLATTHLWHTLTFLTHQARSGHQVSDGLFWQQQALLRTLPTPSALVSGNMSLWWAWRRKANMTAIRCLVPSVVSLLFIAISLAATVSTNYIIDTSNVQVLVNSPHCGMLNLTEGPLLGLNSQYGDKLIQSCTTFNEQCIRNTGSRPSFCHNIFTNFDVPLVIERTECPFASSLCRNGSKPALSVDTGLVDLGFFGINLKKADAVKFRKKTTCAVLPLEGNYEIIDRPQRNGSLYNGPLITMKYGPTKGAVLESGIANATYNIQMSRMLSVSNYAVIYSASDPDPVWTPLPELVRDDADSALLMLRLNTISFAKPVDDPLLSAHRLSKENNGYFVDHPVGALGCIEQYQFCLSDNEEKGHCTPLQGRTASVPVIPGATPNQITQISILHELLDKINMALSATVDLVALTTIRPMPGVPADQWVTEVVSYKKYLLLFLEIAFTDYAVGAETKAPEAASFMKKPATEGEKNLCNAQKMIKSGGFANVNFFGFVFIITFATTIVIIDLTLVQLLILIRTYSKSSSPRLDRWIQDSILQLQRRAFESQGKGIWDKLDDEVPVTRYDEKLEELSVETAIAVLRRTGTAPGIGKSVTSSTTWGSSENGSMKSLPSERKATAQSSPLGSRRDLRGNPGL